MYYNADIPNFSLSTMLRLLEYLRTYVPRQYYEKNVLLLPIRYFSYSYRKIAVQFVRSSTIIFL